MNGKSINETIESANTEEKLSLIFIIVSFLSILGDEYVKKYAKCKNKQDYCSAKKLFIIAISITIIVYFIFIKRNKKNYYERIIKGKESFPSLIRLFGSILLAVGAICLLYFQITDNEIDAGPPI